MKEEERFRGKERIDSARRGMYRKGFKREEEKVGERLQGKERR